MYVYGQLTAPNPDSRAMSVTPITPTRLMSCSMDKIPKNIQTHQGQAIHTEWLSPAPRKLILLKISTSMCSLYKPSTTRALDSFVMHECFAYEYTCCPRRSEEHWIPCNWSSRQLWITTWALGTKPRSSAGAVSASNHWASSPADKHHF